MSDDQAAENDFSALTFVYRNWRGDIAERKVINPQMIWKASDYHGAKPQWFLHAWDVIKGEERDFAVSDILTPLRPA